MGLFETTIINKNTTRPNININLKDLKQPLEDIKEAIIDSNDKLIASQKDVFLSLNGVNVRSSLIESVTEIENNKFSIIFNKNSQTDIIEIEDDNNLNLRKLYNIIASELGFNPSLPVCKCGETTEDINIDRELLVRYSINEKINIQCESCRRDFLIKEKLYRKIEKYDTMGKYIALLDGQEILLNRMSDSDFFHMPDGKL